MTERWEQRLRDLHVPESPDMWARVQEGTRNEPLDGAPSGRQRVIAAAIALAIFVVAGLFAKQAFQPGATTGGGASPPTPTFSSGEGSVPASTLTFTKGYVSSIACTSGGFDAVLEQGATTASDLLQLQTDPTSDFVGRELQSDDVVYGLVLGGWCMTNKDGVTSRSQTAYVLVGQDNRVLAWTVWDDKNTPTLSSPFGSEVGKALSSGTGGS